MTILWRLVPGCFFLLAAALGALYGQTHRPFDDVPGFRPAILADVAQQPSQGEERATEERNLVIAAVQAGTDAILTDLRALRLAALHPPSPSFVPWQPITTSHSVRTWAAEVRPPIPTRPDKRSPGDAWRTTVTPSCGCRS